MAAPASFGTHGLLLTDPRSQAHDCFLRPSRRALADSRGLSCSRRASIELDPSPPPSFWDNPATTVDSFGAIEPLGSKRRRGGCILAVARRLLAGDPGTCRWRRIGNFAVALSLW
jgi:hypothetical protein